MKYKESDFKKGMKIRILKKPRFWNSRLTDNCPLYAKIKYPFETIITDFAPTLKGEYGSIVAGGYGWSLECLIDDELIEVVGEPCKDLFLL